MSRLQLGLNVNDLDTAVDFYTKLFGAGPAKREPGYANFAITDPPLKLVLFEGTEQNGSINHMGVEYETPEAVHAELDRVRDAGLGVHSEGETHCCYAYKDEGWVDGADGHRWELYTVTGDAKTEGSEDQTCCAADPEQSSSQQSCCA